MRLETIFWPSLQCSYRRTRSYTPGIHRAPGAEVEGWEESNWSAFRGSGDLERWARQQFHREENFLPREGSGAGPSRRRPPLRSLTVTSLCARTVHRAASARRASRRGPRAGLGSPPARRRSAGTPGSDRPASIAPKGWRRPADPSIPASRQPSPHIPRGSLSRRQPGSPRVAQAQPVLEAGGGGPGSPQLCSVSGAQGGGHLPYTPARKSNSHADPRRGASFVLQRRAIPTADGGSEEMEEEELGPDAAAAAEPLAAPCALRGGGGGGAGPPARAPSRRLCVGRASP